MPDVSDQERGRRFFQLQKEKHAEEALEKVRKSLGDGWKVFTLEDIKILRAMFGEAWVFTDRKLWETYALFQQRFLEDEPVLGGLFDLNRYYYQAR